MTVDAERLRKLATAATPGPWASEREAVVTVPHDPRHAMIVCGGDDDPHLSADDQEFIAAANPATVLALLDRIDALEGLLRDAANAMAVMPWTDDPEPLIQQCRVALGE